MHKPKHSVEYGATLERVKAVGSLRGRAAGGAASLLLHKPYLGEEPQPSNTQLLSFHVIVTSAVNPRLIEFHHIDIQSTGQKSHCVNTVCGHRNALF